MTKVIYRTVHVDEQSGVATVSHVHAPVLADMIDWTNRPMIGRVYDYAVVK